MRISVGSPILTISHNRTFMVSDLNGQIRNDHQGIFADDTRFLSYYACYIDGCEWIRLSSTTTTYYAARIYLTNPEFTSRNGKVKEGSLSLIISRTVEKGIHEELNLTNYGIEPVSFNLEIALRSDFADIFEVETRQFVRRGKIETIWDLGKTELSTSYNNCDFHRCLIYQISNSNSTPHYANGRLIFEVTLKSKETWQANCNYILVNNHRVLSTPDLSYRQAVDRNVINTGIDHLHYQWIDNVSEIVCNNENLNLLYRQSVEDIGALRLYNYDLADEVWIPAAGVPKFVTLFGRDSTIVSLQNMITHAGFAIGTLKKLGQLQANKLDDFVDAQPGKILHEIRTGELAYLGQIPHQPYYGTADATPLYLILLNEAWKWLGDISLLHEQRDVAWRCLEWIDQYGDFDSDGFQEYQIRSSSPYGIENQGWKDSGDAIVYPDGSQVKAPKALCELQGYVYDAWMRMSEVFSVLGEYDISLDLRSKALKLRQLFEERFWCEDIGFYAFALDADKQPVKTVSSNVGHCLWSGIISPERAEKVVKRLFEPDMWTGWGIRTLSAQNPAYNPFSYHLGSVWPHDNSIIAMGLKRYGFAQEVARVAEGIFDAGSCFANYRLPELYAGIKREVGNFPIPYLEANVPQAWAAASVFQLLQATLGLEADAPNHRLYINPYLPTSLSKLTLRRLEVGTALVDLHFWKDGDSTKWDATVQSGQLEIEEKS
ncbi:amylo-alpha-1,6-glucosidase [Anabaena sp. UHCC 0204]|uniref:amylo-alpha-1,6-glucosidase n=1 Tax=Anabaena sp. UHCC 0204 TaxID=2590009 RepID=UPI001444EF87|nr:amylo-alpha-1,6-glucosidase [Anabaena sp. UHCC 0204]MTJ10946.1 amylo-alpha-1,6-glucosidase [Anabaena sp. UHCC 0204]